MKILSICPTHDSSICLLEDGKIKFFCKEERISRVKRDNDPFKSIDLLFSVHKEKIDHIVFSTPSNHQTEIRGLYHRIFNKKNNFASMFDEYSHHLCHSMLAFVNSDFEEAIVVVIDRDGSVVVIDNNPVARESESVYLFNKDLGYKELHKAFWKYPNFVNRETILKTIQNAYPNTFVTVNNEYSIVKVYEAATILIGQHPLENGKTMGLSSYGEYSDIEPLFLDDVPISHKFTILENKWTCFFNEEQLINKDLNKDNYIYYANRAKQVQIETQKQALNLIKKYVDKSGIKNVCVVGGYGLNVVANNFYIKNLPDVNFYFEPTADDTGVSIGGAMIKYYNETKTMAEPITNNFYHYYDDSEKIELGVKSSIDEIVDMLINGKSVAIFEGNPEAGPRALGHRSILFDARNPNAKEIVNTIKKREWYRPFAGAIIEEDFPSYFETLNLKKSPYMTINFDAKNETKQLVPGIIHVDGTCRIQTVNDGTLLKILNKFKERTNCPMLLNTSFNLAGEPLVQTKKEAIETLKNSSLDAVFFVEDSILVTKDFL